MSYPGIFVIMIGIALGTAAYYYFTSESSNQNYSYQTRNDGDYNLPPQACEGFDTPPSKKRRRNSNCPSNCSICLDKLTSQPTQNMKCGHVFHKNCITMWVRTSSTCPNCRAVIQ